MSAGVGRLAWRTPTGAMLWEIWARRKWHFAFYAPGLAAAAVAVWWIQHDDSKAASLSSATSLSAGSLLIVPVILRFLLLALFIGSCLDLLTCFSYISIDVNKVRIGYPSRLLLKPVQTLRLALVPMIVGGAALSIILGAWAAILAPLWPAEGLHRFWLGAVLVSFFWWMQALGWSLPYDLGRTLVLLVVGVIHFLVGLMPMTSSSMLRGPILAAMLGLAVLTALNGLKWMRFGRWEGPSRAVFFLGKISAAFALRARRKFGSAFQAQFWLEWQRQGRVLPSMSGAIVVGILPVLWLLFKHLESPGDDDSFVEFALTMVVLMPLVISGAMGPAMARFDPVRPVGDLPVYISVRPMTNGGFVVTKLAVALVSSVVTWVLMLIIGVLSVVLFPNRPQLPSNVPFGFFSILAGCIPALLLLILLTWNNLVSGIAAGLTGRPWVINLFMLCKGLGGALLVGIAMAAKFDSVFKDAPLRWLLPLLCLCLTAKVGLSVASFRWGLRRKAVTADAVGWIVGGWLVCGAFVTAYTGLVCYALNKPDYWPCAALGSFLMLPLAGLAIAPMSMAWNRHR